MQNFSRMSDNEVHEAMIQSVRIEKESMISVLHHLQEVEVRRIYSICKFESLFAYATKLLGYSEDEAVRRINAMRLMRELPTIESKVESGALTLSHLNKAQAMFRREKKAKRDRTTQAKLDVLTRIECKPIREVDKTLELETYAPVQEKAVEPVSMGQFPIEVQAKLKRLLEVRSHALDGNDLVTLIGQLAELGLEKWDPVRKAARAEKARESKEVSRSRNDDAAVPATSRVKDPSYISAAARQQVHMRDGGCCTNCGSTRFLQIDHVLPPALGGDSEPANLRLRCRSCNLRHAVETYGRNKMRSFVRSRVAGYRLGANLGASAATFSSQNRNLALQSTCVS